jgi:hypothetical protein
VIETGVAPGVTSRIIFEALQQNGLGYLWSIDLPHPPDHRLHPEAGVAVTNRGQDRDVRHRGQALAAIGRWRDMRG